MGRALHLHLHLLDSRVTAQVVSAYVLQRGSVKPAQQYSHRSYTRHKQVHAQIVRSQRLFHRCSESRALGMRTLLNPMKPLQRIVVELRSQRQAMRKVDLPYRLVKPHSPERSLASRVARDMQGHWCQQDSMRNSDPT